MNQFLKKFIQTLGLVYLLLLGAHYLLDHFLDKENICNNNTWYKIFNNKLNTEIAILGNSRAEAHYNPKIITEITQLASYNLGLSGTPLNILKIRWKSYINRNNKPKIVIFDLDNIIVGQAKNLFEKFQYLPYYNEPEFQEIAKIIDKDYYYEKYIPLYKYRRFEMEIYKKIKSQFNDSECKKFFQGYMKQDINWIEKDWLSFEKKLKQNLNNDNLDVEIYNNGIDNLRDIIDDCKRLNIKLILVWSPIYHEAKLYQFRQKKYLDSIFRNISNKNNISYLNFSNDSLTLKKENFFNQAHLNKKGATKFSRKIAKFIVNKYQE